jgi:hypothetical protein
MATYHKRTGVGEERGTGSFDFKGTCPRLRDRGASSSWLIYSHFKMKGVGSLLSSDAEIYGFNKKR